MLVRDPAKLDTLKRAMHAALRMVEPPGCPADLPLFAASSAATARQLATQVSCHQDIAGDGAFSLGMIAEYQATLFDARAWFYRRLFWETGLIGQVLYLEAEAAGVRATGIGCFFDDPVHRVFGLATSSSSALSLHGRRRGGRHPAYHAAGLRAPAGRVVISPFRRGDALTQ